MSQDKTRTQARAMLRKVVLVEFHDSSAAAGTIDDRTLRRTSNTNVMTRYFLLKVWCLRTCEWSKDHIAVPQAAYLGVSGSRFTSI